MASTARAIAVDAASPQPGASTWRGTVQSVEDGQVLVLFPGATDPTPCATEVKCTAGDVVAVEVSGHRAVVTANDTHPVSDDELAQLAAEVAGKAQSAFDRYKEAVSRIFLTTESYSRDNEEMRSTFRKVYATGQMVKDVYSTITQTAERIMTEVGAIYYTKEAAQSLGTRITQTAEAIEAEVARTYFTKTDGQTLSSKVTQTESDISTLITNVSGIQTLIRDFSSGTLVAKVGATIGALTNSSGEFDVVKLTWSNGVPTIADTYSLLGLRKLLVGNLQAMGEGVLYFLSGYFFVGKDAGTWLRLRQSLSSGEKYAEVAAGGTSIADIDSSKNINVRSTIHHRKDYTYVDHHASGFDTQVGEDPLSSQTVLDSTRTFDAAGTTVAYSQVVKRKAAATDPSDDTSLLDSLYRSYVLRRLNANGGEITHGFYLHIDKDGTRRVTFTAAAPWRRGLVGHDEATWEYLVGDATNGVRYRCLLGVVYIEVKYGSGAGIPASGAKTFGTMPSGFRPGRETSVPAYISADHTGCLWVETGGAVKGNTMAGASQSTFYGCIQYPLI